MIYRQHIKAQILRVQLAIIFLMIGLLSGPVAMSQQTDFNPPYPRIASRPHGTLLNSATTDVDVRHIAKHHVAILATHRTWKGGGYDMATLPAYIKSFNPTIKLFKYMNSNQLDANGVGDASWISAKLEKEKGGSGSQDWWKRTSSGSHIVGYKPDKWQINVTLQTTPDVDGLRWPQWFVRYWNAAPTDSGSWVAPAGYSKGRGLKEGAWDGVYQDDQYVTTTLFASPDADLDNNGTSDDPKATQTANWVADGHIAVVKEWRKLQPARFVLGQYGALCGASEADSHLLQGIHDGGLIQDVNRKERMSGGWSIPMSDYRRGLALAGGPKIVIFHNKIQDSIDSNPGITSVYRWNRYWLTSALMDNGYYAVMAPGDIHPEFDEFFGGSEHTVSKLGYLGYPIGPPQLTPWSQGVFRREFDYGLVLVNPKGNGTRTVNVGAGWKRFQGTQDPEHNNGQSVTSLTLREQDGIILVRANGAAPARPNPPLLEQPQ